MALDFTEIKSGEDFELFITSMLRALSWEILIPPGRGPDGGVDILVRSPRDPNTDVSTVFIIQCKHLASSGRAVGMEHLSGPSLSDLLRARGAQGYILATSTIASQAVQNHFVQLNSADGRPYLLWDRTMLEGKLASLKEPKIVNQYFPKSGTALQRSEYVPTLLPSWTTIVSSLHARTLTDIQDTIGQKYIPDLYVTRSAIEQTLDDFLDAHARTGTIGSSIDRLHDTAQEAFGRATTVFGRLADSENLRIQQEHPVDPIREEGLQSVNRALAELHALAVDQRASHRLARVIEIAGTLRGKPDSSFDQRLPEYSEYLLDLAVIATESTQISSSLEGVRKANADFSREIAKVHSAFSSYRETGAAQERLANSRLVRTLEKLQNESEATAAALNAVLSHLAKLDELRTVLQKELRPAVVTVDRAGRGKTNLVCDLARRRGRLHPTFFLAAKALALSSDSITRHIEDRLRPLPGFREADPLQTLAQLAYLHSSPVIIVIDGINESVDPLAFALVLQRFLSEVRYPTIRIVLTCREEYWAAFAPVVPFVSAVLLRDLDLFTAEQRAEAVKRYFSHYRINLSCEAEALNALQDPLLLRFFCEAFGGRSDTHGIRLNHIRLKDLFTEYRTRKYAQIAEQDRELRSTAAVEEYVFEIARVLLQCNTTSIQRYELSGVIPTQDLSRVGSIYSRLLDEDIILEQRFNTETSSITINFTYEAFLEHVLGQTLLDEFRRQARSADHFLSQWVSEHQQFPNMAGVLGFYLAFLFDVDRPAFTEAIRWLSTTSSTDRVFSIIIALDNLPPEHFDWPVLTLLFEIAFSSSIRQESQEDALRILLRTPPNFAHVIEDLVSEVMDSKSRVGRILTRRAEPLSTLQETVQRFASSIAPNAKIAKGDDELVRWARVLEHFGSHSPALMWRAILLRFSTFQPLLRIRAGHAEAWRRWFVAQQGEIADSDRNTILLIIGSWVRIRGRMRQGAYGGWDTRAQTVDIFLNDVFAALDPDFALKPRLHSLDAARSAENPPEQQENT
jgi:hypothetical protein